MTEEQKQQNGPDKQRRTKTSQRNTKLSRESRSPGSRDQNTQLRDKTSLNSDLGSPLSIPNKKLLQANGSPQDQPASALNVNTVYHQQRQAASYIEDYATELPIESRGLTSNPSQGNLVAFQPTMQLQPKPATGDAIEKHDVSAQGGTEGPSTRQGLHEDVQRSGSELKGLQNNQIKRPEPHSPVGRAVLKQRTFQLEELKADDEEQQKRMVVPKGGTSNNSLQNTGMPFGTSQRDLSQERSNPKLRESPSPNKGQIKKGTVFKKQILGVEGHQSLKIDGSPGQTSFQEGPGTRDILGDQRSEILDDNSIESHPRLMMKGHATQGSSPSKQAIKFRHLPHTSSQRSLNNSQSNGSPPPEENFRQVAEGHRVTISNQRPIMRDTQNTYKQNESDLDQIRDQHYNDYLQQANALLEQEKRQIQQQTADGSQVHSLLQQLSNQESPAMINQSPMGGKRNSQSLAGRLSNGKGSFAASSQGRMRGNSSTISGVQKKHDIAVEEVRMNHYEKIAKALNPFMADKRTSDTVDNYADQAKKRMVPNSYQLVNKQLKTLSPRNQAKNTSVTAVKNFEFGIRMPSRDSNRNENGSKTERKKTNNYKKDLQNFIASHHREKEEASRNNIIMPKTQVQVPKELIMMKIAKRENALDESMMNEQFDQAALSQSNILSQSVPHRISPTNMKNNYLQQDSMMSAVDEVNLDHKGNLPFLPGERSSLVAGSSITQRKESYVDFLDSIQQSVYYQNNAGIAEQSGVTTHMNTSKVSLTSKKGQQPRGSIQHQDAKYSFTASKNQFHTIDSIESKAVGMKGSTMIDDGSFAQPTSRDKGANVTLFESIQVPPKLAGSTSRHSNKSNAFAASSQYSEPEPPPGVEHHITELLERSIIIETEGAQIKPNLDFFKRSIKNEGQIKKKKDVIIKNYRLRMVDANTEISEQDKKLMIQQKGSKIWVSNSLIKPEVYRYSTKVSDAMTQAFAIMRDEEKKPQQHHQPHDGRFSTTDLPQDYESLNFQDQMEMETQFEQRQSADLVATQRALQTNEGNRGPSQGSMLPFQGLNRVAESTSELAGVSMIKQSQSNAHLLHQESNIIVGQSPKQSQDMIRLSQNQSAAHLGVNEHDIATTRQGSRLNIQESRLNHNQSSMMSLNSRTSKGAYYDQEELHAIQISGHLYDKWTRAIQSAGVVSEVPMPIKRYLQNGEPIGPTIKEINYAILVKEGKAQTMLKEREVPFEKLTAETQFMARPYIQLMRSVVTPRIRSIHSQFMNATTKYREKNPALKTATHSTPVVQVLSEPEFLYGVKFCSEELTHLDPHLINDGNLLSTYFMTEETSHELEKRLLDADQQELQNPRLPQDTAIIGRTMYCFKDGIFRDIDIRIISYNREQKKFHVRNDKLGIDLMRERPLFTLVSKTGETGILDKMENEQTRLSSTKERHEAKQYLRVAKLIQNELLQRYEYIGMEEAVRQKIMNRLAIDLTRYPKRSVRKMILQVEALFIFAILKSMLSSQREDPFIRNMFFNFRIACDSPALEIRKQPIVLKADLPGIIHFKMAGARDELENNSLIFSNVKYISMPKALQTTTWNAVGQLGLFQSPLSITLLLSQGGSKYKKLGIDELKLMVNCFPLNHDHFVRAQQVVTAYFNQQIRGKWSEVIAIDIGKTILEDFDINERENMTEAQIDTSLLRLFYQIKQYQQTVLVEIFEAGLRDMVRFLIGFAQRDPDVSKSTIMNTIRHATQIRLSRTDPREVDYDDPENDIVNDLDLVPLREDPFCGLEIKCEEYGKGKKKKVRFIAEPDLQTIQDDMFSIVKSMHDALKGIRRVDAIILPYLERKTGYLLPPDYQKNAKLKKILKMTKLLLEQCCKGCTRKLSDFNKYTYLFDKKTETIVLELKKQSFLQANAGTEGSEEDGDTAEEGAPEGAEIEIRGDLEDRDADATPDIARESPDKSAIEAEAVNDDSSEEEEDGEYDSEDSQAEGGGGGAQNYQAYKSVEVDRELLRAEINTVRESIWTIRENIHEDYDFGLLYVDCKPFKYDLLNHCLTLETHLCDYVKSEFSAKIKEISIEIAAVTGRLKEDVQSIDDVIMLLSYIDTLKRQDNKVEEIHEMVSGLKDHMDYIESLKIMFEGKESDMYQTYLEIRNWPRTFNAFVVERKASLIDKKEELIRMMDKETQKVFKDVKKFSKELSKIMKKGLDKLDTMQRRAREIHLEETLDVYKGRSTTAPTPICKDGSILSCMEWLAQETGWTKKRFNSQVIAETWEVVQQMFEEFGEIDKLCIVINKREVLLGINKTSFAMLKEIQDDLKPLYDLWQVSSRFNSTMPTWLEGNFNDLDGQEIEQTLEEWLIELKRLQKTNLIQNHKRQSELLHFIFELLGYFRRYMPMIKMLRTRGMEAKHWNDIARDLDLKFDRLGVKLIKLIALELWKPEKLEIIKRVSDQAVREYSARCILDQLERDVKCLLFDFESASDGVTQITKNLGTPVTKFEEYSVRINVLKTNPNSRNLQERSGPLETIIKQTNDLLGEWIVFQRNWLYLNAIFSRQDISKQKELSVAMKYFTNIDSLYRSMIKSIVNAPQVFKMQIQEKNYKVQLVKANGDADTARKELTDFLVKKRASFPRLFFLSNEELIDIFGRSDDLIDMLMEGQQLTFLQNLFEGIDMLQVSSSKRLEGMSSKMGEQIDFTTSIPTSGVFPEKWLRNLELRIALELKRNVFFCFEQMDLDLPVFPEEKDETTKKNWLKKTKNTVRNVDGPTMEAWISKFPAQCLYVSVQIWFTEKIETLFISAKGRKKILSELRETHNRQKPDGAASSDDSDEYKSLPEQTAEQLDVLKYKLKQEELAKAQAEGGDIGDLEIPGTKGEDEELESPDKHPGSADSGDSPTLRKNDSQDDSGNLNRSRLSTIEKFMRQLDRFRVDDTVHPEKLYERLAEEIQQKVLAISAFVKKRITPAIRCSAVGLLTVFVYYRDMCRRLSSLRVFRRIDFQWEIFFKFTFENAAACMYPVGAVSTLQQKRDKWESRINTDKLEVKIGVFQAEPRGYGFEYLGSCPRLVITPLTERCQRSLVVAMQNFYGGAPEGPFGTGKTETTKDLSRNLGAVCYVLNTSASYEYDNILKFFKGIAASGAWVVFDEFNRMDTGVLAYLSQVIIQIQSALKQSLGKPSQVQLDDMQKLDLDPHCAVFITTNPGYAGRSELPVNLKNLFRTVSMVVPDSIFITEIMLYASGFHQAEKLAQKVVQIQQLANVLMQRLPHVHYDFGLRSIRAIIGIAQGLKMQAHNIWESELPDIINDSAMDNVPWKGNQMIADVQAEMNKVNESQEYMEDQEDAERRKSLRKSPSKMSSKKQSSFIAATPIHWAEQSSSPPEALSPRSPKKTSKLAQIAERGSMMDSLNTESIGDNDSFVDEGQLEQVHKLPAMNEHMTGEFFEAVFLNGKSRTDRQRKSLLQQIGLSPDMRFNDDELEEYIIIKAIRDYNHCKFSSTELFLMEGIIKDVFTGSVNDIDLLKSDYGNLKELILQSFITEKLDYSKTMNAKCFQLYEISQVNVGCILVGAPQSGKSSMVKLLEGALNRASNNELKIRCAQERKNRLRDAAMAPDDDGQTDQQSVQKGNKNKTGFGGMNDTKGGSKTSFNQSKTSNFSNQQSQGEMNISGKPKKGKKGGKGKNKNENAKWQERYKMTRLEPEEIEQQKLLLANQGVKVSRMNPKSVTVDDFFGRIDIESSVWSEGIFTREFRQFSTDTSRAKKWIMLDGPIDYEWVENLNSILDDNKRINLPNGQTIKMSDGMCMILETDNTRNLTPATISRCGMIHVDIKETNRPKQILNQFLQRLPPNLADYVKDLENQINWLMPTAMDIFKREKDRQNLILDSIDEFWVVQNFVKLLDAFISGYWIDFITSNKDDFEDPVQQAALAKTQYAHGMTRVDLDSQVNDDDKLDPMEILANFRSRRLKSASTTIGSEFGDKKDDFRIQINDFASPALEMRIENSLKFIPMWLEAFTIMSLAWTFQPLLKEKARKELAERIEVKMNEGKSDFASYQKNKKKQTLAKNQQFTSMADTLKKKVMGGKSFGASQSKTNKKTNSQLGSVMSSASGSQKGKNSQNRKKTTLQAFKKGFSPDGLGFLIENEAGQTIEFTDKIECPMFICEFPFEKNLTIFDVYFNMDNSTWTEISVDAQFNRMQMAYANLAPSARHVQNIYIPTKEICHMMHTVEVLATTQQPMLMVGEVASGKSSFMKDFMNSQIYQYAKDVSTEHVTCSYHLDSVLFKEYIENHLEQKKPEKKIIDQEASKLSLNSSKKLPFATNNSSLQLLPNINMTPGPEDRSAFNATNLTQGSGALASESSSKKLRPPGKESKIIVYLEDIHLSKSDRHLDQTGLEALRDYLEVQTWFSGRKKAMRQIEDVNFVACMDNNAKETDMITKRLLYKFFLLGMEPISQENSCSLYTHILEQQSNLWPSQICKHVPKVAQAICDLYDSCSVKLKPTPMKVQYVQSQRECFKIIYAMSKVEGQFLNKGEKSEQALMELFFHECLRLYGDRILMKHDLTWFMNELKYVCQENFDCCKAPQGEKNVAEARLNINTSDEEGANVGRLVASMEGTVMGSSRQRTGEGAKFGTNEPQMRSSAKILEVNQKEDLNLTGMSRPSRIQYTNFPISNPHKLWFSVLNEDVEGCYQQVHDTENCISMVENQLLKYNEQTDRPNLELILYSELVRHLLKIIRGIGQPDGHLIVVGLRGYGITQLIKLASFIAQIQYNGMDISNSFTDDDWLNELRRILTFAIEEDKPACYVVDEYRVQNDMWYKDLECIIKSQTCSEVLRKSDLLASMAALQMGQEKKQREKALGQSSAGGNSSAQFSQASLQQTNTDARLAKPGKSKLAAALMAKSTGSIFDTVKSDLKRNPIKRSEMYKLLMKTVRKNFKVVLNFSPSGDNFRTKVEKYKVLMMSSQLVWIQNLQFNDLVQIGQKVFIEECEREGMVKAAGGDQDAQYALEVEGRLNSKVLKAVSAMYLSTQKIAKKFQGDFNHTLYFTPCFFIRVFETYRTLLGERTKNVEKISKEYAAGLDKIRNMMDTTRKYHKELSDKAPILVERQHKLVSVLVDIEEEYEKVSNHRDMLNKELILLEYETKDALALYTENQSAYDKIMPRLNEAMDSMSNIQKSHIDIIRSMDHPPKIIKLVMKAICMILEEGPTPQNVKKDENGVFQPSYWKTAIGTRVLGHPQICDILISFDRNKITIEKMNEIEDILAEPSYTLENAKKASGSITDLFKWVKAIRDYYYIFQEMEPRLEATTLSQKQAEDKQVALTDLQQRIVALDEQIESLQRHQENKVQDKKALEIEIDDCNLRKKRADNLTKGLSAEKQKQIVCQRMLASKYATVQGDVVLSAAYVTLASGFTQKYRLMLLKKWQKALFDQEISCNEDFVLQELFGDTFTIRDWHSNGLPKDQVAIDNAIIMDKTKQFVIMVDPQQQAIEWIKHQFKPKGLIVTNIRDINFRKNLESAIEMGQPILVQELQEDIDVHLESIIQKEIIEYQDIKMIKVCRRQLRYDDNFQLFMATSIGKPHFDVNISNHISLVNFFVTVEGLTHNLLSEVVANERKDLEQVYNENVKQMYEKIKNLKEIKKDIIGSMETDVHDILHDENLINTLNESKETAETIAKHLKKISSTNQFLQKAREQYAPVAFRASNLYFAVSELYKVNHMYQYSLKWFLDIFKKSLSLANQVNESEDVWIGEKEYRLLNDKYSPEHRISLLIKTFTQELMKKVIFSVFQEDRQLVTYLVSLKVLEAEQLTEESLMKFALAGSRRISSDSVSPGPSLGLPWLNDLMWAELKYLSKLKPFTMENLTHHIEQNPEAWNKLIDIDKIEYKDLPNADILNLKQFGLIDVKQIAKAAEDLNSDDSSDDDVKAKRKVTIKKGKPSSLKQGSQISMRRKSDIGSDDNPMSRNAASSGDEQGRRTEAGDGQESKGSKIKKYTEAEILADDDLWQVSDSDEEVTKSYSNGRAGEIRKSKAFTEPNHDKESQDSQAVIKAKQGKYDKKYNLKHRNPNWYDDNQMLRDEENMMARFLVEKAPSLKGYNDDTFNEMDRRTKFEKEAHQTKEFILRCQVELAILRCIRPDLVQICLHKIIAAIYDFKYANFGVDILAKYIDESGTLTMRSQKMSGVTQNTKTNRSKKDKGQTGFDWPKAKSAENDIQMLLREAYDESTPDTPILMLITHSVEVLDAVKEFQQKVTNQAGGKKVDLKPFSIGKGIEKKVADALETAAKSGDWVLVENIHLAPEWLPALEALITDTTKDPKINPGFRIFFSTIQMDQCSPHLLRKSIKISLQQPSSIKKKIEKNFEYVDTKLGGFRKSIFGAKEYKNMHFGLSYFYAIMEGRSHYGTLGWNTYSGFDWSDFDISCQQQLKVFSASMPEPDITLNMIKYLISNINFGGKIGRAEDFRKMNAHLEDLMNLEFLYAKNQESDMDRSHLGFPVEGGENSFIAGLPDNNPYQIFGFNRTIERQVCQAKSSDLVARIYHLNKTKIFSQGLGFQAQDQDLENTSIKISLAKSGAHSKSYLANIRNFMKTQEGDRPQLLRGMPPALKSDADYKLPQMDGAVIELTDSQQSIDPSAIVAANAPPAENVLHFFVLLQKLLRQSSLDNTVHEDSDRYDEKIEKGRLAERDVHDKRASDVAKQLLHLLDNIFSIDGINKKFPIKSKVVLYAIYNKEIGWYAKLLDVIRQCVLNLVIHIDGNNPKPLEVEQIWSKIQNNCIPETWKNASFPTAYSSLADFLMEMTEKLQWWQDMLDKNGAMPSLWLPAFMDVRQLMNTHLQRRARSEGVPTRVLENTFEVMDFYVPTLDNCPSVQFTSYLHGMSLQGAEWDCDLQLLIEPVTPSVFQEFPVIKCVTQRKPGVENDGGYLDNAALHKQAADRFDDNPQPTKKEQRLIAKLRELKKKRLAQGGKSTENLGMEEENPHGQQANANSSDEDNNQGEDPEDEEVFNEESQSQLEGLESPVHYYECPVFQTTLRLSRYLEYQEKVPVFYIKLPTKIHPRKWVKRSVALLLETTR